MTAEPAALARAPRVPDSPFWVEPDAVDPAGRLLRLNAEESHHLLHVFRAAPGTPFEATDGQGSLYRCVLEGREGKETALGRIEERLENSGELPWSFALLIGLPDIAQAEAVVAHAIPLHASVIDFAVTSRSGREPLSEARLERLGRIARSALKQSRRSRLPELRSSATLEIGVAGLPESEIRWVADPDGKAPPSFPKQVPSSPQAAVSLAVGPPGGFIEWERGIFRGASYQPISLGPSRLSTATAAIALLATARNAFLTK